MFVNVVEKNLQLLFLQITIWVEKDPTYVQEGQVKAYERKKNVFSVNFVCILSKCFFTSWFEENYLLHLWQLFSFPWNDLLPLHMCILCIDIPKFVIYVKKISVEILRLIYSTIPARRIIANNDPARASLHIQGSSKKGGLVY